MATALCRLCRLLDSCRCPPVQLLPEDKARWGRSRILSWNEFCYSTRKPASPKLSLEAKREMPVSWRAHSPSLEPVPPGYQDHGFILTDSSFTHFRDGFPAQTRWRWDLGVQSSGKKERPAAHWYTHLSCQPELHWEILPQKEKKKDWVCSSVVEHLLGMLCKTLGSIPSTDRKKNSPKAPGREREMTQCETGQGTALLLGMSSFMSPFQLTPCLFLSCLGLASAICSLTGGQGGGEELSVNLPNEYRLPRRVQIISHLILSTVSWVSSILQTIKPKRIRDHFF